MRGSDRCPPVLSNSTIVEVPVVSSMNASCHAIALSDMKDAYALIFELHNAAADPIRLRVYEPFLQFEILATSEEGTVVVTPHISVPIPGDFSHG